MLGVDQKDILLGKPSEGLRDVTRAVAAAAKVRSVQYCKAHVLVLLSTPRLCCRASQEAFYERHALPSLSLKPLSRICAISIPVELAV